MEYIFLKINHGSFSITLEENNNYNLFAMVHTTVRFLILECFMEIIFKF